MVIDTSLSAIPVRLLHFLYVLLYFLIYLVFTVIYWLLGGTNNQGNTYIYKGLDYQDFKPINGGLLVFFHLVVLPVLHLLVFGITNYEITSTGSIKHEVTLGERTWCDATSNNMTSHDIRRHDIIWHDLI